MDEEALSCNQDPSLEDPEIILEEDAEEALKIARQTLVGRILADKNLNRSAVKEILSKAWNIEEELSIMDLGPNVFLFGFTDSKMVSKVLQEGPWFVMGHLLSLQNWIPEASVFEVNYDIVGFWIQLHNLPLEMMSTKNATKIATNIGEVLLVENPNVQGRLMRASVIIVGSLVMITENARKSRLWLHLILQSQSLGPLSGSLLRGPTSIVAENLSRIRKLKGQEDAEVDQKQSKTKDHYRPQEQSEGQQSGEQSQGQQTGGQGYQDFPTTHQNSAFTDQVGPSAPNSCHYTFVSQHNHTSQAEAGHLLQNFNHPLPFTNPPSQTFIINPISRPAQPNKSTLSYHTDPILCLTSQTMTNQGSPPQKETQPSVPFAPTLLSLQSNQPKPGLGPKTLQSLDLVKEHICLKEPIMTLDYPSPKQNNTSSFGVNLSPGTIFHCRQKLNLLRKDLTHNPEPPPTSSHTSVPHPNSSPPQTTAPYWVEFPPEEPEVTSPTHPEPNQENLQTLSMGFLHKLAITECTDSEKSGCKRPRAEMEPDYGRNIKTQFREVQLFSLGDNTYMAEEAALIKPPTQP
ncbi:hypothetical protein SESBI_30028 [Sesbania bispinosa]|nr:hypothetical protein SESBI_30028 [Sesbania bispinosa]